MGGFSNFSVADMHLAYGGADCNRPAVVHVYRDRYLNWRIPNHQLLLRLHEKTCDAGSFETCLKKSGTNDAEMVLCVAERNPHRLEYSALVFIPRTVPYIYCYLLITHSDLHLLNGTSIQQKNPLFRLRLLQMHITHMHCQWTLDNLLPEHVQHRFSVNV